MPNKKTDDSLETSNTTRSLGIALGVTEFLFIAGIALLSTGLTLVFGYEWALMVCGGVLLGTAFYNDRVG